MKTVLKVPIHLPVMDQKKNDEQYRIKDTKEKTKAV